MIRHLACAIGVLSAALLYAPPSFAQGVSVPELIRETQKQTEEPGRITLAWWLPEEFWVASAGAAGTAADENTQAMVKVLRPYLVMSVVDGKVGPFGGLDFVDAATLRAAVKLHDSGGRTYAPLPESQLGGDVRNLSGVLRTMFGNMLGAMGEGIQLFFFPAETADGAPIAVASKEGSFSLRLGDQTFKWRLPLSSLLPQKACPEDGEKMSGAWKFCPWHGKPLVAVTP